METRKLISFGSSSYVISLPKTWIQENKLSKGSSIYINELPGELVISPTSVSHKKTKETQIDATNKSTEHLRTELISHYLNYYDLIEVRNMKEEQLQQVKAVFKELAGMEIIEQTQTKIVAKDLINIKEVSLKTLIRRIDIIIRSMFDDVINVLGKKEQEKLSEILIQRDKDVNRLYFLVRRITTAALEDSRIAKMFETNPIELVSDWEIVLQLEKMGDSLKRVVRGTFLLHQKTQQGEIEKIILGVKAKYLELMKAYYLKDSTIAYKLEDDCISMVRNCGMLLEYLKSKNQEKKDTEENIGVVITLEHCKEMCRAIKNIARSLIMATNN